jgi:hypothetical protein
MRKWSAENPRKIAAYYRKPYAANHEKILARKLKYRAANIGRIAEQQALLKARKFNARIGGPEGNRRGLRSHVVFQAVVRC